MTPDRVASDREASRTLRSGNSPIDRLLYTDTAALGPDARRGFQLFNGRAFTTRRLAIPLAPAGEA